MRRWKKAAGAIATAGLAVAATPGLSADRVDLAALERLVRPPLGLPPLDLAEMPSPEAIALGRKLFFDRRLSRNGTMSCGMCHIPEQGFTSNEMKTPVGMEGRSLRRNTPTILNVAYRKALFHDGREPFLETQPIGPLIAAEEMGNPSIGGVVSRVAALPDYRTMFEAAFGEGPSVAAMGKAIAWWQRSMLAADSPFDRWHFGGDEGAVGEAAKRGFELFTGKAGCSTCHVLAKDHALFTDGAFHDTGIGYHRDVVRPASDEPVPVEVAPGMSVAVPRALVDSVGAPPAPDAGRYEVTLDPADRWRFLTPGLRNVALTAPYMHDGSLRTLTEVVRFYDRGGYPSPGLDPYIRPLGLADNEIAALVAFLRSLTGTNIQALIADARSVPVGDRGR